MELPPQLRQLRDFYYKSARTLAPERDYVHAPGLIERPAFFTLESLKAALNDPMLMPGFFVLFWQGKPVDCSVAVGQKFVNEGLHLKFFNKGILEDYLSRGASLVLEGVDILDPAINAFCAALDAAHECVFSNSVVFFSQRGSEAYRGHRDSQDVLAIHLAGEKRWRIHERQPPRMVELNELPPEKMGKVQAEVLMRPGDALFMRSGTPHQVETTGEYSLHMSFDICDRTVSLATALQLVMEEYAKDSAACYTPTLGVLEKALSHAGSEDYRRRLAQVQAEHKRSYAAARALLGANRVRALDRWILAEKAARR